MSTMERSRSDRIALGLFVLVVVGGVFLYGVQGRAFELDDEGNVVWEYVNQVRPGTVGLVEEVQRLAPRFDAVFRPGGLSDRDDEVDRSPVPE
jgi:hypothetical protein